MSFKKTLIFFIIFLVLAGYYLIRGDLMKQEQQQEEAAKKLFTAEESAMTEVTITRGEEDILLKKQDGNWKMLQPVEAAADESAVSAMLSEFVKVERDSTIAEDDSQDEEFGLNEPELIVTAQAKEGEAPLKLSFGKESPVSAKNYVRVGSDEKVILVERTVKTALDKSVFDLRDKTVLDFEPPQVRKAVFTLAQAENGDETEKVELKQINSVWTMEAPKPYNVDATKIGSILSKVKSAKVEEFVTEHAEDLSKYGLDRPTAALALTVGEDSSQKTLLLGNSDEEKQGVYAKHAGAENIFLVSSTILDEFPKSVSDLRDKSLLTFQNDEVQKFALVSPAETIMLERETGAEGEEDTWKITQPEAFNADDSKVRQILSSAELLKIEEFVADAADDLSIYGLASPQLTVQVWTQGQNVPQELLLGSPNEANTNIYAKMASEDTIALVKSDALENLQTTVFDLREKKILGIKQSDVEKLRIEYADGPTFVLEKDENEWISKEPEEQTLTFYKVNNIVYDLENLEFTQKITEPETDLNVYGLVQPAVNVTLRMKDGEEMSFSISKELEGQDLRYLKTSSEQVVFAIDPAFLDELPENMTDIAE